MVQYRKKKDNHASHLHNILSEFPSLLISSGCKYVLISVPCGVLGLQIIYLFITDYLDQHVLFPYSPLLLKINLRFFLVNSGWRLTDHVHTVFADQ